MTILMVVQNNLGHYISFRTFLVIVYDILGDFWFSLVTTFVVIQNNLGHCISFKTFLVVVYDILADFASTFMTFCQILVIVYDNIGGCPK